MSTRIKSRSQDVISIKLSLGEEDENQVKISNMISIKLRVENGGDGLRENDADDGTQK